VHTMRDSANTAATGSPTCRTLPRASANRGTSTMPGSTQPQRIGWTPSRAMSSPVSNTVPSGARIAEMRA